MPCTRIVLACLLLVLFGVSGTRSEEQLDPQARLLNTVKTLAADEFEGRGIGTDGLRKAQQYVREQFEAAGLNVVSAGGDPFQEFDVVDGAELGAPNALTFNGPDGAAIELKLGEDFQVCSFGAADKFAAPVVFIGYGIESEDPAYNDFSGLDVQDKVVIVVRRTPQQGREDGLFDAGPHGTSRHAAIRTKVSNAFRAGAAAILFVNDPYTGRHEAEQIAAQLQQARVDLAAATQAVEEAGGDPDKLTAARDEVDLTRQRVEQTEQVAAEHSLDPLMEFGYGGTRSGKAVPILHISQSACDRLLAAAGQSTLAQLESAIDETAQPHSFALDGWQASGETNLIIKRVDVANVVGVLEGEGPLADETIVIGAHYDHIGFGGEGSLSPGSHEIHNGADDNASGTAALIELARRLAARDEKPARRLVFIAFTGEERGLLGSAQYVKEPLFPLEQTIVMFNMDMVGRLEDDKLTVFGAGTSPRWETLLDTCA
ncbi:MAG: M20/M25/M40 family metallo-hydrolase, partial [Planctomycetaceae bacterium]|nr:M20/M25/M40 family metallo-hydrolase [Planctomycetaceae bacterium]